MENKKKKPIMKLEDALTTEDFERDEELIKKAEELGMRTVSLDDLLEGEDDIPYITLDNISTMMSQLGLSEGDPDDVVLEHKSADGKRSKWRTKVFISGCPADMDTHFEEVSDRLIESFGCEIFSCSVETVPGQTKALDMLMSQMDYIVMLVSSELFREECRATRTDLVIAQLYDIPVLPILFDSDAIEPYNEEIGTYELLDWTAPDFSSRIGKFFSEAELGGELITRVKEAFPKRLFLSYRKKNREDARALLDAIKAEDKLSAVSVWYDDYLVPGENFTDEIRDGIVSADAVILLVTPEILEEGNYVHGVEYPLAREHNIPIYPVAVTTPEHTEELEEKYPDIGEIYAPEELVPILARELYTDGGLDADSQYLIGVSYMYGLVSDRNMDRARAFLFSAARGGSCAAVDKLWQMMNSYNDAYERIEELVEISEAALAGISERIDSGDLSNAKTFWNIADKLEARYQQEGETDDAIRVAEIMVKYSEFSSARKADRLVAGARAYFRLAIAVMGRDPERSAELIDRAKEIIDEAYEDDAADFPMDVYVNIHAMSIQIYQQVGKVQEAFDEGMSLIMHTEDIDGESSDAMKESFLNFATRFIPLLVRADREMYELLAERERLVLASMEDTSLKATLALSYYSAIGLIRHQLDRDIEGALAAFEKAYDATDGLDYDNNPGFSFYAYAKACIDRAGCLEGLERSDEAYEYYEEAVDICRDGDFRNKYVIYREATNRLANILVMNMDKPSEAIDIYLEFLRYAASVRSGSAIVDMPEMQYRIAYILGNYMGDKDEQQAVLSKAKAFVERAIEMYGKDKLPQKLMQIYERILDDIDE